jgi:hypothetical protein
MRDILRKTGLNWLLGLEGYLPDAAQVANHKSSYGNCSALDLCLCRNVVQCCPKGNATKRYYSGKIKPFHRFSCSGKTWTIE